MAPASGEDSPPPPPPPPPPHNGTESGHPSDTQPSPPTQPPAPHKGSESASGRVREMIYPLTLAATSFAVSFVVGVLAASAAATGLASSLVARLLYEVFTTYGFMAAFATVANAVATVVDRQLELLADKYRPATFESVIKVLFLSGREGVPAYQQYPFLGLFLVPAMTAVLFVFMFAWRIVRNLEAIKTLANAAARVRGN
ncbi:hypothetical protein SCUCBS95973_005760 [Sporothrix curviconia]|uniref:Uncharacterized protein n=1 Tax=Sporothrix curviconia TaxID=1260050 RepID=A0ABP0BZK9_9PEZI